MNKLARFLRSSLEWSTPAKRSILLNLLDWSTVRSAVLRDSSYCQLIIKHCFPCSCLACGQSKCFWGLWWRSWWSMGSLSDKYSALYFWRSQRLTRLCFMYNWTYTSPSTKRKQWNTVKRTINNQIELKKGSCHLCPFHLPKSVEDRRTANLVYISNVDFRTLLDTVLLLNMCNRLWLIWSIAASTLPTCFRHPPSSPTWWTIDARYASSLSPLLQRFPPLLKKGEEVPGLFDVDHSRLQLRQ